MTAKTHGSKTESRARAKRVRLHGRAYVAAQGIRMAGRMERRAKSRAVHIARPATASEIFRSLGISLKDLKIASKATGIPLEKD